MRRSSFVKLWCVACFFVAGAAFGAKRELQITPYADQRVEYQSGVQLVISEARYMVVAELEVINGKHAWLGLSILNTTDSPIIFSERSVSARGAKGALRILNADEILKKEKRRQMWEGIAVGLAAAANEYSAAQSGNYTARGSVYGTTYSPSGSSQRFQGNYSVHGTDHAARQLALMRSHEQNRAMINDLQGTQGSREALLLQVLLRSQTIPAGEGHAGRLQIELPRKIRKQTQNFELVVMVGNERHPFMVTIDGSPTSEVRSTLSRTKAHPEFRAIPVAESKEQIVMYDSAPQPLQEIAQPVGEDRPSTADVEVTAILKGAKIVGERIVFDIAWHVNATREHSGGIDGMLVLGDNENPRRVGIPWPISAEDASQQIFIEEAAVELQTFGKHKEWIISLSSGSTGVSLNYVVNPSQ